MHDRLSSPNGPAFYVYPKGYPLEGDHITHSHLGASFLMIIILLMPLIFFFNDMLGGYIPTLIFYATVAQI